MNEADLIERLRKIFEAIVGDFVDPVDPKEFLDELERDGLKIVKI